MSLALPSARTGGRPSASSSSSSRWLAAAAVTATALAACALVVQRKSREAERNHPPQGRFITADGVRLHFTVHGVDDAAQTVVLLHGNGGMAEEMELSGLVSQLAQRYRVIAFDRPGYGHSERPDDRPWGPERQADLLHSALRRLGVERPIVVGHSWGTLVAVAMGLRHPESVGSLVLASGYYFPSLRLDVTWESMPAIPGLGWLMRNTVSPLVGRLLWPLAVKRMFSPNPVTPAFRRYSPWMSLRPWQLQSSAAESAAMIPSAMRLFRHYPELTVPTVVIAGANDRVASARWHSARLHDQLQRSWLRIVEHTGHMVHHVATGQVAAAVDQAAAMVWDRRLLLQPHHGLKDDAGQAHGAAAAPMPTVVPCTTAP